MVLGPSGRPAKGPAVSPAPTNPLIIGRIVHANDNTTCVPMITSIVNAQDQTVTGMAIAGQPIMINEPIKHRPRPDVPPEIAVPNPPPTWHWPGECPWKR